MENVSSNISPDALLAKKIDQQKVSRNTNWAEETHNFDLDITSDIIVGISDSVIRERFIKSITNQYKLYMLKKVTTTYNGVVYNDSNEWHDNLLEWVQIKIENKENDDFFSQKLELENKREIQSNEDESKGKYGFPLKVRLAMLQKQETRNGINGWTPRRKAEYYSDITGCSPNKIYNLITGTYDLTEKHHYEDVEKANTYLNEMGIKRPIIIDRKSKKNKKSK